MLKIAEQQRLDHAMILKKRNNLSLEDRKHQVVLKSYENLASRIGQDSEFWFAPKFTHQLFGEKEQILGFENLSVDITLSDKFLVPLV